MVDVGAQPAVQAEDDARNPLTSSSGKNSTSPRLELDLGIVADRYHEFRAVFPRPSSPTR